MNIQTRFEVVHPNELASLRAEYLASLPEAQELLLEVLVAEAEHHRIVHAGTPCGYFVVHDVRTLLELYLLPPYWLFGEHVFRQILRRTEVRRALVKSFDHLLLSSAIAHQSRVRSLGLLVRDYVPRPLPEPGGLPFTARPATLADLPAIAAVDQPVFTHPARLRSVVASGRAVLFEHDGRLIGFGLVQPVVAGRPEVDVGIAVDAPYRNTGYAIYLFRHLVERCLSAGERPVAGCAEENRASRAMGERIGMVARHRLLELSFDG